MKEKLKPDHSFCEDLNGYCYKCGMNQFYYSRVEIRQAHKKEHDKYECEICQDNMREF